MRCAKCPLYSCWNTENDRGESCRLFGDGWDSQFQYEDKDGTTIGCYIDRNYIKKADEAYTEYLNDMAGMADELEREKKNDRQKVCSNSDVLA